LIVAKEFARFYVSPVGTASYWGGLNYYYCFSLFKPESTLLSWAFYEALSCDGYAFFKINLLKWLLVDSYLLDVELILCIY
jgi:hypothetical protein